MASPISTEELQAAVLDRLHNVILEPCVEVVKDLQIWAALLQKLSSHRAEADPLWLLQSEAPRKSLLKRTPAGKQNYLEVKMIASQVEFQH